MKASASLFVVHITFKAKTNGFVGSTLPMVPDIPSEPTVVKSHGDGPQNPRKLGQSQLDIQKGGSNPAPTEAEPTQQGASHIPSPQFSCPLSECNKIFSKQYELKSVDPFPLMLI
jgi:hypothetical protein